MTTQPSLWDSPVARTTDPTTSHEAAAEHTASGARGRNAALILAAIRRYPGLTCSELIGPTGLDRSEVSKRLSDLHSAFRIEAVGVRRCSVSGKSARTWEAR